ncbi:MAG: hypothetical protein WD906_08995 [Anaerolineales bacterium]
MSASRLPKTRRPAPPAPFVPPYPASWFDHFKVWVERLPIAWWLFYLIAAAFLEGIQVAILSREGIFRDYGVQFFQFFFPITWILATFLMHAFDRRAKTALERFRPALKPEGTTYVRLLYELTTLPAGRTILAGLAGLAFGLGTVFLMPISFLDYPLFGMNSTPIAVTFTVAVFLPTLWFWFTLVYHTIHQLRTVHKIYVRHAQVDLYRLRPVYALAGLTAATALGFAAYTYPWLTDPGLQAGSSLSGYTLVLSPPFYVWPILIFVWPLWGAHRILVERKDQALADLGQRKQTITTRFHAQIDRGRLGGIDEYHKALTTLDLESAAIEKIPTWPWPRGMFRNLMAAFLLPLFIWLLQFGLAKLLQ